MPHAHSLETLIESSPSNATIIFPGNLGSAGTLSSAGAATLAAVEAAA